MITSIQRYCIHDGHGIRTTVFFKGCQLHCPWCANPETISTQKQIAFYANKCNNCGMCELVCPNDAVSGHIIDRSRCTLCGKCVYFCESEAMAMFGYELSVQELLEEIIKDRDFYQKSGGGVTLSGGEAVLQPELLFSLLPSLKEIDIHVALETNGLFDCRIRSRLIPYIDQFLIDLKHMDPSIHKKVLGISNDMVLDNLRCLSDRDLTVRIPLIPEFNDDLENLEKSAVFVKELNVPVNILPFHNMGGVKYEALGKKYRYENTKKYQKAEIEAAEAVFKAHGVTVI